MALVAGVDVAYQFEFDRTNAILRVSYQGEVNDSSLAACYQATAVVARRLNPRAMILDLSGGTSFQVSPNAIQQLADQPPLVRDPLTPRVIVAPTDYVYGMARMFQMLVEPTRPAVHVVHSLAEAHEVLGARGTVYEPLATND